MRDKLEAMLRDQIDDEEVRRDIMRALTPLMAINEGTASRLFTMEAAQAYCADHPVEQDLAIAYPRLPEDFELEFVSLRDPYGMRSRIPDWQQPQTIMEALFRFVLQNSIGGDKHRIYRDPKPGYEDAHFVGVVAAFGTGPLRHMTRAMGAVHGFSKLANMVQGILRARFQDTLHYCMEHGTDDARAQALLRITERSADMIFVGPPARRSNKFLVFCR